MRIAVLAEPDSFHTKKWTQALTEAGQEVVVFSFSDYQIPGIECVKIEPRFTFRGNVTYFSYLGTGKRLRRALKKHRIDLLNPINVTPFSVWARRARLHPMFSVAMGSDILEYPPAGKGEIPIERLWTRTQSGMLSWVEKIQMPLKRWLFRREVQQALSASDFVIGDNWVLVNAVRDWFGVKEDQSALNRWGIEPELFDMTEEEETNLRQKYRIPVGTRLLTSPRGIKAIYQGDIIIEAIRQTLESGELQDTRILMLSAGYAVPNDIEAIASDLESRFPQFSLIREAIPREEMCQLWNLTDVFISAPIYDGYSNALSEGRYIGAVPIVNDTPATQEVMEDGIHGKVVKQFEPEQVAKAIREVMNDVDGWKNRIAQTNRDWVEGEAVLSVNIRRFVEKAKHLLENRSV